MIAPKSMHSLSIRKRKHTVFVSENTCFQRRQTSLRAAFEVCHKKECNHNLISHASTGFLFGSTNKRKTRFSEPSSQGTHKYLSPLTNISLLDQTKQDCFFRFFPSSVDGRVTGSWAKWTQISARPSVILPGRVFCLKSFPLDDTDDDVYRPDVAEELSRPGAGFRMDRMHVLPEHLRGWNCAWRKLQKYCLVYRRILSVVSLEKQSRIGDFYVEKRVAVKRNTCHGFIS